MNNPRLPNTRIELVSTSDKFTLLKPGDKGTIWCVDSTGTIHVTWDNGSTLGLIADMDEWKEVVIRRSNDR